MNQLDFIWAQDPDGYIGKNGTMPWHLPADLKHFKAVTLNHPVIMGANTFKSIGRPLPKRKNIVLTHQKLDDAKITVVHSVEELKELLTDRLAGQRCFVIGGAQIYQTLLPLAGDLYRTVVERRFGGDTKMPAIDYQGWRLADVEKIKSDQPDVPDCRFEHWIKD